MFALEFADAVAELGEGDGFEDFDDGFADFFHDAANAALVFIGTSAALVEAFADAAHRREWSLDVTDYFGQGNLLWMARQTIAARDTSAAFKNAAGAEFVENLFEEFARDVLKARDGLDGNDGLSVVQSEDDQSA